VPGQDRRGTGLSAPRVFPGARQGLQPVEQGPEVGIPEEGLFINAPDRFARDALIPLAGPQGLFQPPFDGDTPVPAPQGGHPGFIDRGGGATSRVEIAPAQLPDVARIDVRQNNAEQRRLGNPLGA